MSQWGISEAMRWDADYRTIFPAQVAAYVTDDFTGTGINEGIAPRIQYQTTTPRTPRYKMDAEMVPGVATWWHEREHHMFAQVQERLGSQVGNELVKAAFKARGANPNLVDQNENLATEQMASFLPEAFARGWGGYAHPCPGVPVPQSIRDFFLTMHTWVPEGDFMKWISADTPFTTDAAGNGKVTVTLPTGMFSPDPAKPIYADAQRIGIAGSESKMPDFGVNAYYNKVDVFIRSDSVTNGVGYLRLMVVQ